MECTPSPRPGNLQRAKWRNDCRLALSDHLSMPHSDFCTVPWLTKVRETTLRRDIEPAQVRLQPGIEDGYVWKPMPTKEDLFKNYLFTKQLSKHSIGAYMELYHGVGEWFEAAPLFVSGNIPGSELEGEPKEFKQAEYNSLSKLTSRINYLESENAKLAQERTTWKDQAQQDSEAMKIAEGRIKQLELELHTAQVHIEKLEQQKIELSSKAWSFRDYAERSGRILEEAWMVLQKGQAFYPIVGGEEHNRSGHQR